MHGKVKVKRNHALPEWLKYTFDLLPWQIDMCHTPEKNATTQALPRRRSSQFEDVWRIKSERLFCDPGESPRHAADTADTADTAQHKPQAKVGGHLADAIHRLAWRKSETVKPRLFHTSFFPFVFMCFHLGWELVRLAQGHAAMLCSVRHGEVIQPYEGLAVVQCWSSVPMLQGGMTTMTYA